MPNQTDTTPEREGHDSWPREVFIQPTGETAIEMLGDRYDINQDFEGETLAYEIGYERILVEINSWDDFDRNHDGYELVDPKMQEEFNHYLEAKNQKEQDQD